MPSSLLLTLLCEFLYALAAYWVLRMRGERAALRTVAVALMVFVIPGFWTQSGVFAQAITVFVAAELSLKMIDYAREHRRGNVAASFRNYVRFLVPFPLLAISFRDRFDNLREVVDRRWELARAAFAGGAFAIVVVGLWYCRDLRVLRNEWVVDHLLKLALFAVGIELFSQCLYGMERFLGYRTRPLIRWAMISRTVGEFWVRYNTRVQRWLADNVFAPSGGNDHPVRGVVLTFLVSAVYHEAIVTLGTGRLSGFQFAFFVLQIPLVLVSPGIDRWARRGGVVAKGAAHALVVAWFTVTSVLFFQAVDQVIPFFYAHR